jgi:hypothetical protein
LLLSSQYGEMTEDTLTDYLEQSELEIGELVETVELPTVDIDALLKQAGAAKNGASRAAKTYDVVITCKSAAARKSLLRRLKRQGYQCRPRQP